MSDEIVVIDIPSSPNVVAVELVGPKGDPGTTDHRELSNRNAADQHPISAIEGLAEALGAIIPTASETVLGGIMVGANLKIDENGVLSVDTATLIDYIDTVILGGVS